jgi:phospholipid transport system substrate-binding protein
MIRRFVVDCMLAILLLAPPFAGAADSAPETLVRDVTNQVLTILRSDKEIRGGDRARAMALVEAKVAPHFDFTRMTGLAVGRAWQQADAAQRTALVKEFRTLLVRTYANSLTAYRNQTVNFKPGAAADQAGVVTVRCQINQPGAQPIGIDYSLAENGGSWKVFDVQIAGISLVTSYRETFASEMARGGIDGLLQALREKNRHLDATHPTVMRGGHRQAACGNAGRPCAGAPVTPQASDA